MTDKLIFQCEEKIELWSERKLRLSGWRVSVTLLGGFRVMHGRLASIKIISPTCFFDSGRLFSILIAFHPSQWTFQRAMPLRLSQRSNNWQPSGTAGFHFLFGSVTAWAYAWTIV